MEGRKRRIFYKPSLILLNLWALKIQLSPDSYLHPAKWNVWQSELSKKLAWVGKQDGGPHLMLPLPSVSAASVSHAVIGRGTEWPPSIGTIMWMSYWGALLNFRQVSDSPLTSGAHVKCFLTDGCCLSFYGLPGGISPVEKNNSQFLLY